MSSHVRRKGASGAGRGEKRKDDESHLCVLKIHTERAECNFHPDREPIDSLLRNSRIEFGLGGGGDVSDIERGAFYCFFASLRLDCENRTGGSRGTERGRGEEHAEWERNGRRVYSRIDGSHQSFLWGNTSITVFCEPWRMEDLSSSAQQETRCP